jgi:hypothetical protein
MDAKVEIIKIGPKRAAEMLENMFEEQRPPLRANINRLAAEMKGGKWRLSSDCIVQIAGKLANGQHRLQAVIISETTQPFLVMETDDHQLYKVLDCGKSRTVADVLQGEYATDVAAIARQVMLYDLEAISLTSGAVSGSRNTAEKVTRSQIIGFAESKKAKILECAAFCRALSQKHRIIVPTIMATVLFLADRDMDKPKKIRDFVTHVYDGNSSEDAAHDLRERLLRSRMGAAKLHRNYLLAITIKSFNEYVRGKRLGQVKMNAGESFPRLK